jgi:hypothetical protein
MNSSCPLRAFLRVTADPGGATALLRAAGGGLQHHAQGAMTARIGALRVAFPTVAMLLGDAPFQALAGSFSRTTPAGDWDLNAYGRELPEWIAAQQPDADGAALADVARVDWAMHRACYADDRSPLDRPALAVAAAGEVMGLLLLAHPATGLVRSRHPVVSLWQSARDATLAVPAGVGQSALVGRHGHDEGDGRVWMRPVQAGEATFVAAVLAGQRLGQAVDAAAAVEPDFDVGAVIARHLADQVWSEFTVLV